ncbi:MAG: transcription-repair coupling factor [Lachnospiraceae bacterium]|jgi:transcription-repair coupling factor (superfamily II helicase)|nr:transcription-repair coupling factor [Lachnospiraceae bacterium]
MNFLLAPLKESESFRKAEALLRPQAGAVLADGCADSQKIHLAFALSEAPDGAKQAPNRLFLTYSDLRAREIYEDCCLYDRNAVLFPARDLIFYQADLRSRDIEKQRLSCLRRISERRSVTVVTTFSALMTPQVPLQVLRENIFPVSRGETISEETIASRLTAMGYERNYQVDSPGQFSIRGDIADIFDLTEENPVRIELWGDEVESIRSFDILSQRSIEELESVRIFPASELLVSAARRADGFRRIREDEERRIAALQGEFRTEEAARLRKEIDGALEQAENAGDLSGLEACIRYFYPNAESFLGMFGEDSTILFFDEPHHVREHADAVETEFRESMMQRAEKGYILPGQMDLLFPASGIEAGTGSYRRAALTQLGPSDELFPESARVSMHARTIAPYNNSFEALKDDLEKFRRQDCRTVILCASNSRARHLAQELTDSGITAFASDDPDRVPQAGEIETACGHVLHGFEYPDLKFIVIAETDIFSEEKKKKRREHRFSGSDRIRSFNDLKPGDYVVHEDYGIGIYRGIEKIEVEHIEKDYIHIEYGGKDNLYILPTELNVLMKYSGGGEGKAKPALNRFGTQEWSNTRRKVQKAVDEVADDLVRLYADRRDREGHVFGPDTIWQKEFEELFPYEETEDQLTAIEDTKRDMESPRIMDRLICGDVGYGKTEVALRAAFKAVQDNMQVAVLVPTTILAQQHFNTFVERMRSYPVTIEMLSRFRSSAEQKKTIQGLQSGRVDIVIGTHRLQSSDVKFKNLGLLVVDEEQRFGVAHKEKIKKLRSNVDVLTLTATPIPRTLHMSLSGIRDMSILEEAPGERRPIQTYVLEYNEEMIREAIVRELSRNGQVYYVYNRVNDIAEVTARLQKLVPEARMAFADGQMPENELEDIMYRFISREIDVLVATTIIESGLDISNVNTIIIHDSDRLGLAQLYQLRGRVGRSDRTAYAFLMYRKDRMLREEAEKRLSAIREFTELGSGYRIAMRDLEIRGAGSVLGHAQHGHMAAVGYDLYCRMLNTAVKKAEGETVEEEKNTSVDLNVDAFIPGTYIVNEEQKLDIYKKISAISSTDDVEDMKDELVDRFGEIPQPAQNLLRIALLRSVAHRLEISDINGRSGMIRIVPDENAALKVENIPQFLTRFKGQLRFIARGKPCFEYSFRPSGVTEKDEETLLSVTEELLIAIERDLR